MGFAKYQEDIVSRFVGDQAMRQPRPPIRSPIKPVNRKASIRPPVSQTRPKEIKK